MATTMGRGDLAEKRTHTASARAEAATAHADAAADRPRLVFFHSKLSGRCRRTEGFLAQVLQRRRNHGTFSVYRIAREERADLVERFSIERFPTLVIVEGKRVRARLEQPRGCRQIEDFLAPWLR